MLAAHDDDGHISGQTGFSSNGKEPVYKENSYSKPAAIH